MVAYEAACGELRTHYAGFFDPGFGYGDGKMRAPRWSWRCVPMTSHSSSTGQTFFKVVYDQMLAMPTEVYGTALGSSYQRQAPSPPQQAF